jgi:hypothetical protein
MLSGISSIKESGKSVYIAVYFSESAFSVYRAESDIFTYQGSTVTASQTQQTTVTGATVAGQQTTGDASLQPPTLRGNPEGRNHQPVIVVTPNTPTPLPQSQQQMAQPSPTTLATTPCAGPYSDPINRYNKASDVDSWFREGRTTIPCATIATDAKTKLTVTLTDGTFMKPGPFTFKDVAMENKEDKWVGFMMSQETKQWIQLEVTKEKKLTYAACLDQCAETSSTAPTYRQKKDLEVKHDKDKRYTFDGGTVEYTEENPFNKGMSPLTLGLIIGIPAVVFIAIVIAVLVFINRGSVAKGVSTITTRMSAARDNALMRLQSWRGNSDTSSQTEPLLTSQ